MNLTRRGFCALSGVAAASVLGLGLAGCGGQAPQAETKAEGPADEAPQDYLTQGKGEHLVCGVTGKLIKIAPPSWPTSWATSTKRAAMWSSSRSRSTTP